MAAANRVRVGMGGWNYAPWRGTFYPEDLVQRRELEFASRRLNSIEINSTFYGSQKPASFVRWRDETPAGFMFSVKGPRAVTQRRTLASAGDSIARFFDSGVLQLADRLGPINWQLAPSKQFDAADMEAFFALLPRKRDGTTLRHAIEVRHASFANARFMSLASRHGVAVTLAGDSAHPRIEQADAPLVYARIMGTTERYRAGYAPRALDAWAARAGKWAASGRDVFLYVIGGFKQRNPAAAMAILERLQG